MKSTEKTEKIVNAVGVSFSYEDGTNVLEKFDFNVKEGSFTALLGHNGSGKSSFARLLNGMLFPTEGTVYVTGIDTKNEETIFEVRKACGLVFQNPDNQIIASVVEDDVAFAPENLGVPPLEIRKRVDDALKSVGMYEYKDSAPQHLSGGQKQRVAIAGIVAMRPRIIVLDEPTAMLDPVGRREVIKTIKNLNKNYGITVILITHNMDEAAEADRISVMENGKIILDGTPKEVFSEYDTLIKTGLGVPQITELAHDLNVLGFPIDGNVLTVDEFVASVIKADFSKGTDNGYKN